MTYSVGSMNIEHATSSSVCCGLFFRHLLGEENKGFLLAEKSSRMYTVIQIVIELCSFFQCRSYFMFHGMDVNKPHELFKYLPMLSFTESYIYQVIRTILYF